MRVASCSDASFCRKIHEYNSKSYFIEFWEIGGSKKYALSRSIFYRSDFHGLILVHDLTNYKSHKNLHKWIKEVLGADTYKWKSGDGAPNLERDGHTLELDLFRGPIPVLIVGTKADLISRATFNPPRQKPSPVNEAMDSHSIEVNTADASAFANT